MPRRLKDGLDYFPLDVRFFSDTRIRRLSMEYGPDGPIVYIMFLTMAYSQNGYYIEGTLDRLAYAILYDARFKEQEKDASYVRKILNLMVELELIDHSMLRNEIITSKGIQKQFLASTQRRKKKEHPHWILTEEEEASVFKNYASEPEKGEIPLNGINVDNNPAQGGLMQAETALMSAETPLMPTEIPKVKVKVKKKVKEDKEDKYDKTAYPGYLSYYTKCLIADRIIDIYDINIDLYNDLFDNACRSYERELVRRCFRYTRDYVRRNKESIWDVYSFFRVSFEDNLSKMEGYDERMEHWHETMQAFLDRIREESQER